MKLIRYPVLIFLGLSWLSLFGADPREQAISKAKAQGQPAAEQLLASLRFVVIGYEGNLPLFEAGVVPPPQNGTGIAVPIDADGYFLTAAHSVQPERPMYVMGLFGGALKALKAEIVFRGDPAQVESDFAILKVEETLPNVVPFATGSPRAGNVLFAAVRTESTTSIEEGVCIAVAARAASRQNSWLVSDLPAIAGDSGGPVMASDFKLVGLTSRTGTYFGVPRTASCCPSEPFVRDSIASWKNKRSANGAQP